MIIINDNDYSNPYDKSNDNNKKKEWITKTITLLLMCVAIKAITIEIIRMLIITIMIIVVMIIINNSNL